MDSDELERQAKLAELQMLSAVLGWYFDHSDMPRSDLDQYMRRYGAAVSGLREAKANQNRNLNPTMH